MTRKDKLMLLSVLLVGILIGYFSIRHVKFSSLMHDIIQLKYQWLLAALLMMVLSIVFEALVVKILVKEHVAHYPFLDALRVPLVELLFNGITPFSSGGQPAQLFVLLQSGVEAGKATSMLLMKFVVYQAMIVVNFVVCLIIGFEFLASKLHALFVLVVLGFLIHFMVILSLILIMYWYSFTKKLLKIIMWPLKFFVKADKFQKLTTQLEVKMETFHQESLRLKANRGLLLKMTLLTLCQLSCYYVIPYFILLALGAAKLNLLLVTAMHVLIVMIISLFPIPGGTGGAEYSFSMIFSTFIGQSKLVLAMLLWRIITYYLVLIAGAMAMVVKPKTYQKNS
ncbi:hypothetical protein SAMN05216431_1074 [Ligilactobacillus sp. WC1T17]|uniref:Phosphatidylglycerol lysyltransferase n=1 Tax=Ligilactobacillus ruminis TaxID=1623 RepID=A0ABY1ABS0_9LACO|nr:hypothetical protein SAMN05216431_1074 [Ligilactobacillus ruminis]